MQELASAQNCAYVLMQHIRDIVRISQHNVQTSFYNTLPLQLAQLSASGSVLLMSVRCGGQILISLICFSISPISSSDKTGIKCRVSACG